MTSPYLLSSQDFELCFAAPMRNVTEDADPKADIWSYIDVLNLDGLGLPSINDVQHVYRDALERFDQVLIGTGRFNTLLAIIVDREKEAVFGHYLLDLNDKFDLKDNHLRKVG